MPIQSLYSKLQNPTTTARTRVVDQFDGDTLDERWTINGGGTNGMVDAIDEGFTITTLGGGGGSTEIDFNLIRHYDPVASEIVGVWRPVTTTVQNIDFGLTSQAFFTAAEALSINHSTTISSGFWTMIARNDPSSTNVQSGTAISFAFRNWRLQLNATSGLGFLQGVLETTITTNLPDEAMEPVFFCNGVAKTGRIRYIEVYNT